MYVCIYVGKYAFMYVCKYVCMIITIMYMYALCMSRQEINSSEGGEIWTRLCSVFGSPERPFYE